MKTNIKILIWMQALLAMSCTMHYEAKIDSRPTEQTEEKQMDHGETAAPDPVPIPVPVVVEYEVNVVEVYKDNKYITECELEGDSIPSDNCGSNLNNCKDGLSHFCMTNYAVKWKKEKRTRTE